VQASAPAKKKVQQPLDDLDDLDEEEAPPRKSAIAKKPARRQEDDLDLDEPRPKKKKVVEDDYDDEDEAPRSKKARSRDDDYDDEEDAPRGKKPKKVAARAGGPTSADDKQWAFLMYIILIVGNMIGIGPIGGVVWWFIKRKESKFVDYHGKQYINANITYFVMLMAIWIVCAPLGIGLYMAVDSGIVLFIFLGLGFVLTLGVGILSLVCFIKGILAARAGDWYIPPMAWQLLK